jgi:hypothetical protein
VRCALKTPYRDRTTHIIFEPEDFVARLAALVPKPHAHLIRYHGVFAPASPDRARVVPKTRVACCQPQQVRQDIGRRSATAPHLGATAQRLIRDRHRGLSALWREAAGDRQYRGTRSDCADSRSPGSDRESPDPANPSRAPPQADLLI